MRGIGALLVLGVFFGLASQEGFAQSKKEQGKKTKKEQAKQAFEEAEAFYRVLKYEEALAAYQESYLLSRKPLLLFNIGQCYLQLERYEEAIKSYKSFLRDVPSSPRHAEIKRMIAELEEQLTKEKETAEPPPPSTATVVPSSQESPGPDPEPASSPASTGAIPEEGSSKGARRFFFIGAAGAGALSATFGALSALRWSAVKRGQAELDAGRPENLAELEFTEIRARQLGLLCDAFLVVAAGSAITGLLSKKSSPTEAQKKVALSVTPKALSLWIRF